MELKEILSLVISTISIFVTGLFSYLVWKATRKSSEVAQASFELSREIASNQEAWDNAQREEYRRTIIENAEKAIRVLEEIETMNPARLPNIVSSHGISQEKMARFFNINDREMIARIWSEYTNYLDTCWTDSGELKKYTIGYEEIYKVTGARQAKNVLKNLVEHLRLSQYKNNLVLSRDAYL